ncbi:MAG TPA: DUF2955 domain-containing protein [Pseudomonadales bacterium]
MAELPLAARRVFRLAGTTALALGVAYGIGTDLPFIAPIFALMLTAPPAPPRGPKALAGLALAITITLGVGPLLAPMLQNYPVTALLVAAVGIYLCNHLSINLGKGPVATLLTMGITMVSAVATLSHALAVTVIESLAVAVVIAIVCQWIVYPWFPEAPSPSAPTPLPAHDPDAERWISLRATLVVLPAYLLALTNPTLYLPVIMKSVTLGQQTSLVALRGAGGELLGSTCLGGIMAILFWFALGVSTNLWMFTLWMLLFGVFFASRFYQVVPSRFTPSFWMNAAVTMLILLGSAVQDSANDRDVYQAFAVRMSLFVAVTCYAFFAIMLLERWRRRLAHGRGVIAVGEY